MAHVPPSCDSCLDSTRLLPPTATQILPLPSLPLPSPTIACHPKLSRLFHFFLVHFFFFLSRNVAGRPRFPTMSSARPRWTLRHRRVCPHHTHVVTGKSNAGCVSTAAATSPDRATPRWLTSAAPQAPPPTRHRRTPQAPWLPYVAAQVPRPLVSPCAPPKNIHTNSCRVPMSHRHPQDPGPRL